MQYAPTLLRPIVAIQTRHGSPSYKRSVTGDELKTGLSLTSDAGSNPSSLPSLPPFLRGLASSSMLTTSLMEGRSFASFAVQSTAILRTKSISSSTCLQFPTFLSIILVNGSFSLIFRRTHSTMSTESPNSGSTGRFPVMSSIKTTP
ncbi:hypothetical protein HanRHA438_Chr01g0022871 [Helianthus annuus]|nr:hypothetical protein HanRHA438_Chr01g0022871 [Helianthus annuus]